MMTILVIWFVMKTKNTYSSQGKRILFIGFEEFILLFLVHNQWEDSIAFGMGHYSAQQMKLCCVISWVLGGFIICGVCRTNKPLSTAHPSLSNLT